MTYRRKPETVEAIQWNGDNLPVIEEFCDNLFVTRHKSYGVRLFLQIGGSKQDVLIGDYIIKRAGGCVAVGMVSFELNYEPCE